MASRHRPRAAHGGAVKDGRSPPPRGASAASVLDGAEYADHLASTASTASTAPIASTASTAVASGRVTPGPAEAGGLGNAGAGKQERPRRRSDEGAGAERHEPSG